MEFTPSPPPPGLSLWRRPGFWVAALALLGYGLVLAHSVNACAGGSDSSGYLNNARLLAAGHVRADPRVLRDLPAAAAPSFLYAPLGFKPAPVGVGIVPTYPTGLPLLIVAAVPFAGWRHACDAVMVLHAMAAVLLVYALARCARFSRRWSVLATAIVAVSPLTVEYALQAMSDLPAMVWVTGAVLLAWYGGVGEGDPPPGGRRPPVGRRATWALGAGFAFAMAVLIRPSNLLAILPVAIALGSRGRSWISFILGGLPGAVFFAAYNHAAYGHWLATGYGDTRSAFSLAVVPGTLRHYLHWLPILFTPVVLPTVFLPFTPRREGRVAAILGTWALGYLGFYSAYFNTHETWWYLRFVLPAAPALAVGGMLVVRWILAGNPRSYERGYAVAALALVLGNGVWLNHRLQTLDVGHGEGSYPAACAWLREHVPSGSVIAAMQLSGALTYYTDFTVVRWDQMEGATFARVETAARAEHRPVYAALYGFETERALQLRMPGPWQAVGTVRDVTVWRRP